MNLTKLSAISHMSLAPAVLGIKRPHNEARCNVSDHASTEGTLYIKREPRDDLAALAANNHHDSGELGWRLEGGVVPAWCSLGLHVAPMEGVSNIPRCG